MAITWPNAAVTELIPTTFTSLAKNVIRNQETTSSAPEYYAIYDGTALEPGLSGPG